MTRVPVEAVKSTNNVAADDQEVCYETYFQPVNVIDYSIFELDPAS